MCALANEMLRSWKMGLTGGMFLWNLHRGGGVFHRG